MSVEMTDKYVKALIESAKGLYPTVEDLVDGCIIPKIVGAYFTDLDELRAALVKEVMSVYGVKVTQAKKVIGEIELIEPFMKK